LEALFRTYLTASSTVLGLADGSRRGEERRDRFAGAQPDRSVQAIANLGGRIDSEALVDGRGKIGRSVGAAGGIGADLVGTADGLASLNASTGKGGREDGCPVVTAIAGVIIPRARPRNPPGETRGGLYRRDGNRATSSGFLESLRTVANAKA
jgi:hypothetical protein